MFERMRTRRWGIASGSAVAVLAAVAIITGQGASEAQEPPPEPEPSSEPSGPLTSELRWNPFELAPADADAIQYDDMANGPTPELADGWEESGVSAEAYRAAMNESKAGIDQIEAWAQLSHTPAVASKWSEYTASRVAAAQARRAEYESGLSGTGDVGVE